ncbi:hypothetical protein CA51_00730 [Rosistilla oblonga]|uniref:hypothetical protein n=1 Tax=Rosistilla oblonga TaxID=2527990 RepID=UPI00118AA881|nr:hypothetical protein [Rosistilla oblonga]QDV10231.1 hypothetical protein CA51_00730 [Rosistilla oblonga]
MSAAATLDRIFSGDVPIILEADASIAAASPGMAARAVSWTMLAIAGRFGMRAAASERLNVDQ